MVVMPMSSDFDQKVERFFKNYQDRGMKKWTGFFLSDHTLKINRDRAKRAVVYHKKSEMSEALISQMLFKAFSDHYYVKVQLKELDNEGKLKADVCGFVEGYQEKNIIISGKKVAIDNINHVELEQ